MGDSDMSKNKLRDMNGEMDSQSRFAAGPVWGCHISLPKAVPLLPALLILLASVFANFQMPQAQGALLTVQLPGSGTGTVNSSPSGITCPETCSYDFTSVTLYAAPDDSSLFSGWGGACAGLENCTLSLTGDSTVTALFTLKSSPVQVSGSYYGALQNAYESVAADGIVMAVAQDQPGDLTLDRDISFTLKGGYDAGFSSNSDNVTYVDGVVSIASGSMTVENIAIGQSVSSSPLAAPSNVIATPGSGQVSLSWDTVSGATSYNAYFSTATGVTRATGTKVTGTSSASLVVTGLINGTTYYFVVTAVSANGESVESGQVISTPSIIATATSLATTSTSVPFGTSITLTATVSPSSATGAVTFYDGSASLGSATISSGTATLATSSLTMGSHTLTAAYGGSTTYSSSTSNSVNVTVTSSTDIDISPYAVSVAESVSSFNAADVVTNNAFDYTVIIDFTANTARLSSGAAQTITTDGVALLTVDSTGITVTKTTYGITITSTVDAKVRYNLSGQLSGTLTVNSSSVYQLYLNGIAISATAGPALDLESTQKVFIVSAAGSTNALIDSSTRSMTMKAALYGKGPMVFSGDGTLSVTGSYKHGIFSNDYIRVRGGTLNVAVSTKDAVRSVNGFIYDDGKLTINATGTTIDDESKGIKVEGSESTGTGKGYIVINGGYITITSVSKAITASWDIDEDATTTSTADDPSPYVQINNGVITITTTGTPYEYVQNGTTVSCSPEGIEGKSTLTINSGYLTINTSDDSLNSGGSITINGGYIYCASSANDAIDSNGTMTIAGGVIVAIGSSAPEGAFDCDTNTFNITGGTFVGIGGTTSGPTAASSTQNAVILGSLTSGSTMAIKASNGTSSFAFTIPQSYATMLLSSPALATGTTYTIYDGGTASANKLFKGLYLGNLSYSGGTIRSTFTISSRVTQLGGQIF